MGIIRRLVAFKERRLRPFRHVHINDVADMEAHSPHVLQCWKRLRYRRYLLRTYKPRDDLERVAFERHLKKLLPHPLGMAVSLVLAYTYLYPAFIVLWILSGRAGRTNLVTRAAAPETMSELDLAHKKRAEAALKVGIAVQLYGENASVIARSLAATLPRDVIYVRVPDERVRDTKGMQPYPVVLFATYWRLTTTQAATMLRWFKQMEWRPVMILDLQSPKINEQMMRQDLITVARGNCCDVVYVNSGQDAKTWALARPVIDPGLVVLLTDAKPQSTHAVKAAPSPLIEKLKAASV
jgi:hypothetical protein